MNRAEAVHAIVDSILAMAKAGRPLMQRVLPDGAVHWWTHYPDDDARDERTRSRWYYHVHPPGVRDDAEHGHFHLFLHRTQLDDGFVPLASPADGDEAPAQVIHIAGLSVDRQGIPTSWFATNRWVTDEFLYSADVLASHLGRYDVDRTPEDVIVNRFLTAMVALYHDEIADLLRARDAKLAEIGAGPDKPELFEAGEAVLAVQLIDLDAKIESLGAA